MYRQKFWQTTLNLNGLVCIKYAYEATVVVNKFLKISGAIKFGS